MHQFASPEAVQHRALELASRGLGRVEPNPPVGAVIVDDDLRLLGEGSHERFGGPHAEINALNAAGERAKGATLVLTLEPCCHQGKTGPCTDAILAAGIRRVVVGTEDPNPQVAGGGIAALLAAGVEVEVETDPLARECRRLIAPFAKLITLGIPWVHAKWAMTLDGRIATRTGHSRWISNEKSRRVVHELRGRMDAILVGAETVAQDDPLLTARPPGPRTAQRIVVSRSARLPADCQLARTAQDVPTIVTAIGETATAPAGIEVLPLPEAAGSIDLRELLRELGRREMTNLLVEGGSQLLGAFHDAGLIDEVHVFIAPKIVGGKSAVSPLAGIGCETVPELPSLDNVTVETFDSDMYVRGDVRGEIET